MEDNFAKKEAFAAGAKARAYYSLSLKAFGFASWPMEGCLGSDPLGR